MIKQIIGDYQRKRGEDYQDSTMYTYTFLEKLKEACFEFIELKSTLLSMRRNRYKMCSV